MSNPNAGTQVVHAEGRSIVRADAGEAGAVALTAQIEAQVKARAFLAMRFPRNWTDVRNRLLGAFERPMLAEGAIYSKPIGGNKRIEGLSIRFAEEAFRTMGNVVCDTMLVSDDDDKRVYIVAGSDLETNASFHVTVAVTKQIERKSPPKDARLLLDQRTNSYGEQTYIIRATSEDDYRSKEGAALAKARRDVILFLTPADIQEECTAKIRETIAKRDKEDPQGAINRLGEAFFKVGVTVRELEKFLGHPIASMNEAELHVLRTVYTALREGETTWAAVAADSLGTNTGADAEASAPAPSSKSGAARLAETLKAKSASAAPATESQVPTPPPPTKGKAAPAAAAPEPEGRPQPSPYVAGLLERMKNGERLSGNDAEEVRDYRLAVEDWDATNRGDA